MRFKLDENFPPKLAALLVEEGYDAETVLGEGLSGHPDEEIYDVCLAERRTLITLDLDFSNPLRFPPIPTEGIIAVRPPRPVLPMIRATLKSVIPELRSHSPKGELWIVEPARIRVFENPEGGAV